MLAQLAAREIDQHDDVCDVDEAEQNASPFQIRHDTSPLSRFAGGRTGAGARQMCLGPRLATSEGIASRAHRLQRLTWRLDFDLMNRAKLSVLDALRQCRTVRFAPGIGPAALALLRIGFFAAERSIEELRQKSPT